jgi:hypothetical protein
MTQQRLSAYCERQPPFPDDPDSIIWRQPTPSPNPDPNGPSETTILPDRRPNPRIKRSSESRTSGIRAA